MDLSSLLYQKLTLKSMCMNCSSYQIYVKNIRHHSQIEVMYECTYCGHSDEMFLYNIDSLLAIIDNHSIKTKLTCDCGGSKDNLHYHWCSSKQ